MNFNSLLFVLIYHSSFFITAYSQAPFFNLSLQAGLNAAQISGDNASGFSQFGLNFGGNLQVDYAPSWALSTGIQFQQRGARSFQTIGNTSSYNLRLNYIDVPLVFAYALNKWRFLSGISFNVLVNQKEVTEFGAIQMDRNFRFFELAGLIGVKYALKKNWEIGIFYHNSMLPVRPHDENYTLPVANNLLEVWHQSFLAKGQYNSTLSISIYYLIGKE